METGSRGMEAEDRRGQARGDSGHELVSNLPEHLSGDRGRGDTGDRGQGTGDRWDRW